MLKDKIRMRKNTGITLVALVITIIVLLILAGVTLSLTLGENGLLKRAEESKNAHLAGERNDIEFMNSAYNYMDKYFGESGIKELEKDEITNPNLKDNENIKAVITGEVPIPEGAEYKEGTKETGKITVEGKVDRINNIYDLEGNGREWTTEADWNGYRTERGGACDLNLLTCDRDNYFPYNSFVDICSRSILCIK